MGVEVVRGDIRDRNAVVEACRGVDCVFHVAALPGISMKWQAYDDVNRHGTDFVLAGCRAFGVPRLVYTSSPSVVFAGEDQRGADERASRDFEWMDAHRAYYSLSKARAEKTVLADNSRSLRTCALRPHLIWGPRDSHLIPRLIARARAGRLRKIGDGTNLVDIAYVENVAEAHLLAADALNGEVAAATGQAPGKGATPNVAGKVYFLSQGQPVNCWKWIDEILALADLPPVQKTMSFKAAWRLGAACETVYRLMGLSSEPPMTRFLAAQLAKSHWFDIGAARRDLGYEPRVSTAEGMRRLGEWLRQAG
jgi:nucleoside-diphosphate-sugar epimerase